MSFLDEEVVTTDDPNKAEQLAKKGVKVNLVDKVSEKKGKDLDGDGDIDSADYLAARDRAIKRAQGKVKETDNKGYSRDPETGKIKSMSSNDAIQNWLNKIKQDLENEDNLDEDLGTKIGDALFGKSYDRPFSDFMDTVKDLLKKDKTTSSGDDNKLILKIASIEKGELSEKEFKSVLQKLKNAGMSDKELKNLENRYNTAKKGKEKKEIKEDKQIKVDADQKFVIDLKHLMQKHGKEDTIKITKKLMKKLHDKGEVKVDGTKLVFKKNKNKTNESSIMGVPLESFADYYTALALARNVGVPVVAFSALLAIMGVKEATRYLKKGKEAVMAWYEQNKLREQEDTQLALPEPDAPDFLGDDGVDYEGGMAKSQMLKMKKYAAALCDMIEDESQLEAWVQAKLTKASDYMSAVYHYLDYQQSKMNEGFELNGKEVVDLEGEAAGEDSYITAAYYSDTGKLLSDDEIEDLVNKYPAKLNPGGSWWDQQR